MPKTVIDHLNKFKTRLSKSMTKLSRWYRALIGVFLLLILFQIRRKLILDTKEGFTQAKQYVMKEGDELWDEFYCSIYDDLFFDHNKNNLAVVEIKKNAKVEKDSRLLDIGCGAGHYIEHYRRTGNPHMEGLEKSKAMYELAKKKFPKCKFTHGDATDPTIYIAGQFTHITCFDFTIYYIRDKRAFFKSCFKWLRPGGHLILHMVNRDKFDPIIPAADPLQLVSAQKFAKKRITNSIVKFKDFLYKCNYDFDKANNMTYLKETMKDDETGNVRENNHILYMDTQKNTLNIAKQIGFILMGTVSMKKIKYEDQFLYFLYKPAEH